MFLFIFFIVVVKMEVVGVWFFLCWGLGKFGLPWYAMSADNICIKYRHYELVELPCLSSSWHCSRRK